MSLLPQLERELLQAQRRSVIGHAEAAEVSRRPPRRRTGAGGGRRRGRRMPRFGPVAAAGAVTALLAALLLTALLRAPAGAGPGRQGGGTVVLSVAAINPGAALGGELDDVVAVLEQRFAGALPGVHVARAGDHILLRGVTASNRSRALALVTPGRLAIYDWEADALAADGHPVAGQLVRHRSDPLRISQGAGAAAPGTAAAGAMPLYDAVRLASLQRPSRASATAAAPRLYYLFGAPGSIACDLAAADLGNAPDAGRHCYLAGPAASVAAVRQQLPGGVAAPDAKLLSVPPGTLVLAARSAAGRLSLSDPRARFFVLRGATAVPSGELSLTTGNERKGTVTMSLALTAGARAAFSRLTSTIAGRGRAIGLQQHFAVALDGQLLGVAAVDFNRDPTGLLTWRTPIAAGVRDRIARDMVATVRSGSLALAPILVASSVPALHHVSVAARFATPRAYLRDAGATPAVTYDRRAIPVGGQVEVYQTANKWGGMDVLLRVAGLRPDARYDAQVHVGRCTDNPASSGGRLQNGPSNQHYSANEFWLDVTTNFSGAADVLTQKYWGIGKHQRAGSVVLYRHGRVRPAACVTVPFARLNPGW